ncbi:MAG: helix-hairpin-helix domain-containing protein [Actinomycetota bacterium]
MSLRERLDQLSRGELAGLVVVVVATLLGAGLWYMQSLPRPVDIAAPADAVSPVVSQVAGPTGSLSPSPVSIIVDVAGWVREPGVYEFASGDRVIDAVDRAGGARKGADLTSLNLAAPLTDGTQIVIPRPGATMPGGAGSSETGTASGGTALININTASETELEDLPGVGPVTAAAIIDYRTQNGPFSAVDDLIDVSGIGPSTLEQIRPFATV